VAGASRFLIDPAASGPGSSTTGACVANEFAAVDPALATLLGRTPTSFEAFLRAELAADTKA